MNLPDGILLTLIAFSALGLFWLAAEIVEVKVALSLACGVAAIGLLAAMATGALDGLLGAP